VKRLFLLSTSYKLINTLGLFIFLRAECKDPIFTLTLTPATYRHSNLRGLIISAPAVCSEGMADSLGGFRVKSEGERTL
jgi:hypothetical protein